MAGRSFTMVAAHSAARQRYVDLAVVLTFALGVQRGPFLCWRLYSLFFPLIFLALPPGGR